VPELVRLFPKSVHRVDDIGDVEAFLRQHLA
jgi:hypothetical protein